MGFWKVFIRADQLEFLKAGWLSPILRFRSLSLSLLDKTQIMAVQFSHKEEEKSSKRRLKLTLPIYVKKEGPERSQPFSNNTDANSLGTGS